MKIILLFLVIINVITILLFVLDKRNAIKGRNRVSEATFHTLAMLGGVYSMMLMMHFIHHKNKKFTFYIITIIIAIIWLGIVYYGLNYYLQNDI